MTESNPYESEPSNQRESGNIAILTNIFVAPSTGMMQAKERFSVLFPFFVMMILTGTAFYFYFSNVDYNWYVDYMVEVTAGDKSKAEQDATRDAMSMMSQGVTAVVYGIGSMVSIAIVFLLHATYFLIVSKVNGDGFEFKQWFSFVAWASMPGLLAILAMFAMIFTSENMQIAPEAINPLSLNELFFGLEPSKGMGKLLSSLHLPQFWSMAVMVIGYKAWTNKSMMSSALVVLMPFVVIYLAWLLFI